MVLEKIWKISSEFCLKRSTLLFSLQRAINVHLMKNTFRENFIFIKRVIFSEFFYNCFWKRTNSAICMYLCTIVTMPLYLTEKPRNIIFRILLEYIRHNIWNLNGFSQNSLNQNFSYPIWISRFFFVYLLSLDIDFN